MFWIIVVPSLNANRCYDDSITHQVWENAIYFWTDLQHYHELFYQDGTDPYRIQREAQVGTHKTNSVALNIRLED